MLPAAASAQDGFCAQETACTTGLSVTSATTIVGVGATMLTRIRDRKVAAIDEYLRHNRVALLAAATVGGGDAVNDLAWLGDVAPADVPRFAARLRARRADLVRGDVSLALLILDIAEG